MSKKRKQGKNHMGSSIDDFLKEEGIFEEAQAQAVKEVVAWELQTGNRKRKKIQKKMAKTPKTPPNQNQRIPSSKSGTTPSSPQHPDAMVGRALMDEVGWRN